MSVLDLPANWRDPVRETLSHKTDILVSRSGKEQRRALRQTPRKSLEFLTGPLVGDEAARLRLHLSRNHAAETLVPDPSAAPGTGVYQYQNGSVFHIDAQRPWMIPGVKLLLERSGQESVEATIAHVSPAHLVTVETFTQSDTPAVARPLLPGYLRPAELTAYTGAVIEFKASFEVKAGAGGFDPGEPLLVRDGREVLVQRPNWARPPSASYDQMREMVDFDFGLTTANYPHSFVTRTVTMAFLNIGEHETHYLRGFFQRHRGRARDFLMPTWEDDIFLTTPLIAGETQILASVDLVATLTGHPLYKHVAAILTDGRILVRTIVGIVTSATGSTITIDDPWPSLTGVQVAMISLVAVQRLANDQLQIDHVTDGVSQVQFSAKTIPHYPSEYTMADTDAARLSAYETGQRPIWDLPGTDTSAELTCANLQTNWSGLERLHAAVNILLPSII